ncbi:MAG TPA: hypothetical protein VMT89_07125 [Candidatus Acidoferrales bacterium]|nr:hypothetical protein [Candidatus Acidoferrales bacterium]
MAAYNKVNITAQDVFKGVHNISTATALKIKLSNTLPTATMNTSTEITEISTGNGGYTAGGSALAITSSIQTSGTYILKANALVFTAGSSNIGPFQYAVLYNSTAVTSSTINGSSAPLLGWYDYGSAVTLAATETFTITWDATSGVLQLA